MTENETLQVISPKDFLEKIKPGMTWYIQANGSPEFNDNTFCSWRNPELLLSEIPQFIDSVQDYKSIVGTIDGKHSFNLKQLQSNEIEAKDLKENQTFSFTNRKNAKKYTAYKIAVAEGEAWESAIKNQTVDEGQILVIGKCGTSSQGQFLLDPDTKLFITKNN